MGLLLAWVGLLICSYCLFCGWFAGCFVCLTCAICWILCYLRCAGGLSVLVCFVVGLAYWFVCFAVFGWFGGGVVCFYRVVGFLCGLVFVWVCDCLVFVFVYCCVG